MYWDCYLPGPSLILHIINWNNTVNPLVKKQGKISNTSKNAHYVGKVHNQLCKTEKKPLKRTSIRILRHDTSPSVTDCLTWGVETR